jgi:ribosomal protein S18 acetylase RimI-like enzyme
MQIVRIDSTNIDLLYQFIKNPDEISPFFRYFQSRDPRAAFKNHVYTVVGIENDIVVAYGHIDYETKYWFGICVLNTYQGKGYGKQIINSILEFTDSNSIDLALSVDSNNIVAIELYKKNGFIKVKNTDTIVYMERKINLT